MWSAYATLRCRESSFREQDVGPVRFRTRPVCVPRDGGRLEGRGEPSTRANYSVRVCSHHNAIIAFACAYAMCVRVLRLTRLGRFLSGGARPAALRTGDKCKRRVITSINVYRLETVVVASAAALRAPVRPIPANPHVTAARSRQ